MTALSSHVAGRLDLWGGTLSCTLDWPALRATDQGNLGLLPSQGDPVHSLLHGATALGVDVTGCRSPLGLTEGSGHSSPGPAWVAV